MIEPTALQAAASSSSSSPRSRHPAGPASTKTPANPKARPNSLRRSSRSGPPEKAPIAIAMMGVAAMSRPAVEL